MTYWSTHKYTHTAKHTKQKSHTQFQPEKNFHRTVNPAGNVSSCTKQKASIIHRWLDELQGIHMAQTEPHALLEKYKDGRSQCKMPNCTFGKNLFNISSSFSLALILIPVQQFCRFCSFVLSARNGLQC